MSKRLLGFFVVMVLGVSLMPGLAEAHTVEICWRAGANGTLTFYAGSYHPGSSVAGGLLIDGQRYNFTSQTGTLPAGVECQPRDCLGAPAPARWLIVNVSDIDRAEHSLSTTCTSHTECPISGCYPQTAFFGICSDVDADGVCDDEDNCPDAANPDQADRDDDGEGDVCDPCPDQADATDDPDGDRICGDADNCPDVSNPDQRDADDDGEGDVCDPCPQQPDTEQCSCTDDEPDDDGDGQCTRLDLCPGTALPESVPTVELLVNHFADVDGDGEFETTPPNGVGPRRSYNMVDTAGCSCEQIIEEMNLGEGHRKHGCSIGAMDNWVRRVNGNTAAACEISHHPTVPPWALLLLLLPLLAVRRFIGFDRG